MLAVLAVERPGRPKDVHVAQYLLGTHAAAPPPAVDPPLPPPVPTPAPAPEEELEDETASTPTSAAPTAQAEDAPHACGVVEDGRLDAWACARVVVMVCATRDRAASCARGYRSTK